MSRTAAEPFKAKIAPGHPLFATIEEAYRLFSGPKPTSTEVCECCMDAKIEADFFGPPIRDLPLHYVQDWYFASADPGGMAQETWAYLLPRILEILAVGEEVSHVGSEVSLSRFETGNPAHWSDEQWRVLDDFRRRYLAIRIAGGEELLDDALCMFRLGGWPLDSLFAQVAAASDEQLARRFWSDWCRWPVPGREAVWTTTFWQDGEEAAAFAFYTSPELHARMAALALAEDTDAELAEQAAAVAGVIEAQADWLR